MSFDTEESERKKYRKSIETFRIPNSAKIEYLNVLMGKIHKILHLIEEEKITGFSPRDFIAGQLFEVNAANTLFNNELSIVIIKLKGVYDTFESVPFKQSKKQIFEISKILNNLLKKIEEDNNDANH